MPMKAGGPAKHNANLELGVKVSTATQRPANTTRHRHTKKLSEDTYITKLYTHQDQQRGREVGGANCRTKARFGARKNRTTFLSEYASSEARRKPVCQKGAHDHD